MHYCTSSIWIHAPFCSTKNWINGPTQRDKFLYLISYNDIGYCFNDFSKIKCTRHTNILNSYYDLWIEFSPTAGRVQFPLKKVYHTNAEHAIHAFILQQWHHHIVSITKRPIRIRRPRVGTRRKKNVCVYVCEFFSNLSNTVWSTLFSENPCFTQPRVT